MDDPVDEMYQRTRDEFIRETGKTPEEEARDSAQIVSIMLILMALAIISLIVYLL